MTQRTRKKTKAAAAPKPRTSKREVNGILVASGGKLWALSRLKAYDRNARIHDEGQIADLAEAIRQLGFLAPIVVRSDGEIIAGHGRALAAERLGMEKVPVVVADHLSDAEARAARIADNRFNERSRFDQDLLAGEIEAILASATPVAATGFSDDEVADLLKSTAPPAGLAPAGKGSSSSEDAEPETSRDVADKGIDFDQNELRVLRKKWSTERGQLWEIPSLAAPLRSHRIVVGDCFDPNERARLLDGVLVGLSICDPPYAIFGSSTGVASDVADDSMVRPFFEKLFRVVFEMLPWFGHAYTFTDWRSWSALWEGMKRAELTPRNCLVWDKSGSGKGSAYAMTHEMVAFAHKIPPAQSLGKTATGVRTVHAPNVLRYPRVRGKERKHNAAKPVAMLQEFIRNSSDRGDVVADLFMGSGSTLLACEREARIGLGMEQDPRHAASALERFETMGLKPKLLTDKAAT